MSISVWIGPQIKIQINRESILGVFYDHRNKKMIFNNKLKKKEKKIKFLETNEIGNLIHL